MDRGAWQTMVREVTKGLYTTEATKHINSYAEDLTPSTSECDYIWVFKEVVGTSLVVLWLGIHLSVWGTWVPSLVWEDPTCWGAIKPGSHKY